MNSEVIKIYNTRINRCACSDKVDDDNGNNYKDEHYDNALIHTIITSIQIVRYSENVLLQVHVEDFSVFPAGFGFVYPLDVAVPQRIQRTVMV